MCSHAHRWDEDQRRLDLSIHGDFPQVDAHGIVGQSYTSASVRHGKLDVYAIEEGGRAGAATGPLKPMTTSAQAEGAIEGVYTDYKLAGFLNTEFKYSRYLRAATVKSGATEKRAASTSERAEPIRKKEL